MSRPARSQRDRCNRCRPIHGQRRSAPMRNNEITPTKIKRGQIHMPHMKFRLDIAVCCVALLLSAIPLANASALFATTTLVVPDEGNNRVLLYSFPVTNGQAANVVLGQSSFSTSAPGTSASTMGSPSAYAVDQVGNLYVSDTLNCRVLQFRPP